MIEAEIIEDELKAPVLKDIKYPVKIEDLHALMSEFEYIPTIDLSADDEIIGEQYQIVLNGHKRFVKARTSIEKVRKELKAPALEYGKKVDSIAKEFQSMIKPFEDKLLIQRKAVEDNEARKQREAEEAEEARISNIEKSISEMERLPLEMMSKTSLEIREFLSSFDVPTEDFFEEYYDKALVLHSTIQTQLNQMANDKELVENAKKIQAQKEAEQKEQMQKEREEFEAQREAFNREREEFEAQQRAMREEKERKEAERLADELQAKQEAERLEREKKELFEKKEREAQNKEKRIIAFSQAVEDFEKSWDNGGADNFSFIVEAIQEGQIRHIKWED